jgi:HEAT repeat protein
MRAVLVAVVVCAVTPTLRADPEPKYEGKPLDYWVQRFQKAETVEVRDEAARVIKIFGPRAAPAVPALIEMLSDLSPDYRGQVIVMLGAIGPAAKDARPAVLKIFRDQKADVSASDFAVYVALYAKPEEAVPDLIPFLDEPACCFRAFMTLCDMGPAAKGAIPAIRKYALNELAAKAKDKMKKPRLYDDLAKLGPDVVPLLVEMFDAHGGCGRVLAIENLEKLGPEATAAAPALKKLLKDAEPEARFRACRLLWNLQKSPDVVPVLAALLTDASKAGVTPLAIDDIVQLLGEIGPAAKDAIPALKVVMAKPPKRAEVMPAGYLPLAPVPAYRVPGTVGAPPHDPFEQSVKEAIDKIEGKPKK